MVAVRKSASIEPAWQACSEFIRQTLGEPYQDLTNEDLRAVLATFIGPRIAPYGSSPAVELKDIMTSPQLACANLVHYMAQAVGDAHMDFLGVEGGAVGNHAQILYRREDVKLLLDPTIGLIARTDLDSLFRGYPVQDIVRYYPADGKIMRFADKVQSALSGGKYRASDLLYYYESWAHMRNPNGLTNGRFITPGGMKFRQRATKH